MGRKQKGGGLPFGYRLGLAVICWMVLVVSVIVTVRLRNDL